MGGHVCGNTRSAVLLSQSLMILCKKIMDYKSLDLDLDQNESHQNRRKQLCQASDFYLRCQHWFGGRKGPTQ